MQYFSVTIFVSFYDLLTVVLYTQFLNDVIFFPIVFISIESMFLLHTIEQTRRSNLKVSLKVKVSSFFAVNNSSVQFQSFF